MKGLLIFIAGAVLLLCSSTPPVAGQTGFFISKGSQADQRALSRVGVVRARPVDVDFSQMPGADGRGELPRVGHELLLNVFDDVVLQARMERAERTDHGMKWVGKLKGKPLSDVVIVIHDGVMAGSIVSPDGAYSIRYDGSSQVVEEVDRSALPPEAEPLEPLPLPSPDALLDPTAVMDDGSTIDVLVVYTPAARISAGGASGIQSRIQLGVAETNAGYANSGVLQRLRLLGAVEVSYTESGDISTDLNRLTYTDGLMDNVQGLRDAYKADLVSLITNTPGSAYCGIAWLMGGNSLSFAPNAYSVVEQTCISPGYTFGHELGHNMGLNHARTDPVGDGAYSYSYGYKDPASLFRTVMAYDCPISCPRILNFSNPNVFYSARPTGIVETAPNSAYNALSLNNTRLTIANFRTGGAPAAYDLTGDGSPDILWHHQSGGFLLAWSMRGLNTISQDYLAPSAVPDVQWQIRGMGDVNRDGKIDLLWHHQTTGDLQFWLMNGLQQSAGVVPSPGRVSDLNWQIKALADFNGDGNLDILWQHKTTGTLYVWTMNGLTQIGGSYLTPFQVADTQWQVRAAADFNGDGKADILWHHAKSGVLYVWYMNSSFAQTGGSYLTPFQVADTQWQVRAAADFNSDGKPDLLWHHQGMGYVYVWTMNGTVMTGGSFVSPNSWVPDTLWQPVVR